MRKFILVLCFFLKIFSCWTYNLPTTGIVKSTVLDKNKIWVQVYVDCTNINAGLKDTLMNLLDVDFGVFIGDNANPKSPSLKLQGFHQDSLSNIYRMCDGYQNKDNPYHTSSSNGKYNSHLIRYYFSDTIDLVNNKSLDSLIQQYGSDVITFFVSLSRINYSASYNNILSSNNGIIISSSVYLNNLNRCKYQKNSGAHVNQNIAYSKYQGLTQYNPQIKDNELDKISVKFQQMYGGFSSINALTYNSGYTFDQPLKTYVGTWGKDGFGKANNNTSPPRGVNLDTLSGNLSFYNFEYHSSLFELGIFESRLDTSGIWVYISRTGYVIPLHVGLLYNSSPVINCNDEYSVIEGDTVSFDFTLTDDDKSDSVSLYFQTKYKNVWVKPVFNGSKLTHYHFSWLTDSTHTNKAYHIFAFEAFDQYCKDLGVSSKAVKIHVLPRVEYENISRDTICNRLFLEVKHDPVPGRVIYEWDIKSQSGNYQWKLNANTPYGNRFLTQSLPNDTYYITSLIRHDSLGFRPQTDTVILNAKPEVFFVGDTSFCKNTSLAFKLDTLNLTNLSKISMLSSSGSLKKSGLTAELSGADSLVHLWFEVTDSVGCTAKDSIWVFERPQEERVWAAIPTGCYTGSLVYLNPLWSDFEKRKTTINNTDNWVVWKDSNVYLDPQKVPLADFIDGIQTKSLFLSYNDSWNCRQHDTVEWLVAQPVEVQLLDTVVCQNQSIIDLNDLVQKPNLDGSGYQPTWSLAQWPSTVNQNGVWANTHSLYMGSQTDKTREGIYKFAVSFKKYAGGCVQSDTVQIQVINEPQLQFASTTTLCRYTKELNLLKSVWVNGQPASTGRFSWDSYNWNKTASEIGYYSIINGTTAPADLAAGNWRVRYEGPTNGCMDTGFFTLRVFHSPVAKIDLSTNPNLNIHAAQMTATHSSFIDDNSALTWLWDAGDTTTTSDTSSKAVFQYTYPKIVGNYPLTLIVNSEKGCKDTTGTNIELTDNAGLNKLRSSDVYQLQSNGEVKITSPEWQLESIRWYDLKGAEIRKPKEGINIYQIVLKRGKERFVDSGKWVKRGY